MKLDFKLVHFGQLLQGFLQFRCTILHTAFKVSIGVFQRLPEQDDLLRHSAVEGFAVEKAQLNDRLPQQDGLTFAGAFFLQVERLLKARLCQQSMIDQ